VKGWRHQSYSERDESQDPWKKDGLGEVGGLRTKLQTETVPPFPSRTTAWGHRREEGRVQVRLGGGKGKRTATSRKRKRGSVVAEPQFPKEERQPASPCADVLPRSPISGIVGCCARAPSGHITVALPRSVMNSRRPHWLPSSRGLHPTTSLSESCVVHNSKIGSQWQLWLKAGPRGASRHVRLAAVSGLHLGVGIGRGCANNGLMHCSKTASL
jgi:hypothetical protein